jgi:hypothetical protein
MGHDEPRWATMGHTLHGGFGGVVVVYFDLGSICGPILGAKTGSEFGLLGPSLAQYI